MILIESMKQLEAFIDQTEKSQEHIFHNYYLYEEDAGRLIGQRRLFCEIVGNDLYIYSNEGAYYQMYFFSDIQEPICACNPGKPVVCEVLFREGDEEGILKIQNLMHEYRINKTSRMYAFQLKGKEHSLRHQYNETRSGCEDKQIYLRSALQTDLPALQGLWSYLDPLDIKHMTAEELMLAIVKQEIIVAESGSDGVCGTVWRTKKGCTSLHKQLAVNENMRGNGVGRFLVLSSLMRDLDEGTAVQTCWLDTNNHSTLRLHDIIGFVSSSKLSEQFVL